MPVAAAIGHIVLPKLSVLLIAEGFGGAQMGGAVGGDGSENEAHEAGNSHGDRDGRGRPGNADAGE